jgi:hypothetical protein
MFQIIEESEQRELEECLAPCAAHIEFTNYNRLIGAGWTHPNGGRHAIMMRASFGVQGLLEHIRYSRHYLVARAEWAHVRDPSRWQRLTMWARPKYRAALAARLAAFTEANRKDQQWSPEEIAKMKAREPIPINRIPPLPKDGEAE